MLKSPFPGMDPFLERHWRDVHVSLITFSRGQLNRQLRPPLRATAEERVYIETDENEKIQRSPDVFVVEHPSAGGAGQTVAVTSSGTATDIEPIVVRLSQEPTVERYLEIVDAESGDKVITVIEFLSPTNKRPGEGREAYLAKRKEYLRGGVNIVEVDLTREGPRGSVLPVRRLPPAHRGATYMACFHRAGQTQEWTVYPIPLAARLPTIPIPLRPQDSDAQLDLQAIIDQAYEEGHHDMINYTRPLEPPFAPTEAGWIKTMLKEAGRS
jgi:Protein of unknown function (DUF4058)